MSLLKRICLISLVILFVSILGVLIVIYPSINLLCIPYLFIDILLPIFATRFLLYKVIEKHHLSVSATGTIIGIASSIMPTTTMIVTIIILLSVQTRGEASPYGILPYSTAVTGLIGLWFGLLIISALSGLITAAFLQKKINIG